MKIAFAVLVTIHGAIHLLGFAKAFGLAELPQLGASIERTMGLVWLLAALACFATATLPFVAPSRFWIAALTAIVASQVAIATSWSSAKFGTIPNLVIALPLAMALLDLRPSSFRNIYAAEVAKRLTAPARAEATVTDADLASLPSLLSTYLRRAGVVGRPHVRNVRARWIGTMRNGPTGRWMRMHAEQVDFFDDPARIFLMNASRSGVPVEALHVYARGEATMKVRVGSAFDVVDARGPIMNRSETVTLFNDMCLLAPASLLRANVVWETLDDRRVRGTFTNAGHVVSAELVFDERGDLATFVSRDRSQSADGKTYRTLPWSTPVRDYRVFEAARVPVHGDAVWSEPDDDFTYARFDLETIEFNVATPVPSRSRPGDTEAFVRAW